MGKSTQKNELLYEEILEKREKMHEVADDHGISSIKTLTVSQELDHLLNQYIKSKLREKQELKLSKS
ncbi:aspartyl-phosphate phosphatase Spo0E family protein [Virgibacillus sp. MSP4-1]|uniref:Spo0E like sporulation regulatory protein n=1 Tax=Salinibacillus aidingensis TaxID=237684 RepID=A0ABN1BBJ8_9BACI|nr:aspartyl-phosphate phosphatase Spo0E family protein [Virgibacillus sp. MSP4-1]QHS22077.1 aspartyl-phosphate phosphatase Spo0E family protein [Virgibacillus sp. MSP4-1]QHS22080.1 aspartyl-phosphate phosphatase Spo0E family protein [Virgibacillus sp. MSP4-1]